MNYLVLNGENLSHQSLAREVAQKYISAYAQDCDRLAKFPRKSLEALKDAGLWSLQVPKSYGGMGANFVSMCLVIEEIAKACPSTALCYKMHLEATSILVRTPTTIQSENALRKLANGEMFAAFAGREPTGPTYAVDNRAHLSKVKEVQGGFKIDNVRKICVTSSDYATHFLFLCHFENSKEFDPPEFLLFERNALETEIGDQWDALGMRGTDSRGIVFNGVAPKDSLLVAKDCRHTMDYLMPTLILSYGATYLGIATGAFELASELIVKPAPNGFARIQEPIHRRRMAELSVKLESAKAFLYSVAALADREQFSSTLPLVQARTHCSQVAVEVTQELMAIFGGSAYTKQLPFERYFRDARAGLVMGISADQAYEGIASELFPRPASV